MSEMTYAEAHAKLMKEIEGAEMMKQQYVVLPLPVAERLDELCRQVAFEDWSAGQ